MNDERLHDWLAKYEIKWQFNTSRAPWWGGQFERIVGLVKQALYKAGGSSSLTWNMLQDLLLDVEVALNNRPLSYVENDPQLPVLTPNSLMFHRPNHIPTPDYQDIEGISLRKTAKQNRKVQGHDVEKMDERVRERITRKAQSQTQQQAVFVERR